MLALILLPFLLNLITSADAFNDISPSYVDSANSYYVSEVVKKSDKYVVLQKQQILQTTNSSSTSSSSSSYSTASVQTATMTAGMSYLYSNEQNQAYSVNITLNSKDYPVLIDTGSPYLWLYSVDCEDESCKGKELFDPKVADKLNGTFQLSYDSGIASGDIYKDSIIIAGFETENFEFGVANKVPNLFENYGFSGVLGLPANNASVTGLVNAVSFLSDNGDIDTSKFTICLGEYDSDSSNDGLLFLGSRNDILHNGLIYTSPIIDEAVSHWEIKIDNIYVDDYQISFDAIKINNKMTNTSRIGLLDSGTTSLILSTDDANKIHSFFESSITDGENYAIFCNSTLNFDFEISGKNWTLTPDMYIGNQYPSTSQLSGYCVSNIQGIDSTTDGAWILGILFMKNKYVEFDYENQWIGLAERNDNIKFVNPPKYSNSTQGYSISSTISASSSVTTLVTSTSSTHSSSSIGQHSNIGDSITNKNNYWIYSIISLFYLTNLY